MDLTTPPLSDFQPSSTCAHNTRSLDHLVQPQEIQFRNPNQEKKLAEKEAEDEAKANSINGGSSTDLGMMLTDVSRILSSGWFRDSFLLEANLKVLEDDRDADPTAVRNAWVRSLVK